MYNVYNFKILIIGLTAILALVNFTENDFRKHILQNCNSVIM
jgi:hypothetical protein